MFIFTLDEFAAFVALAKLRLAVESLHGDDFWLERLEEGVGGGLWELIGLIGPIGLMGPIGERNYTIFVLYAAECAAF